MEKMSGTLGNSTQEQELLRAVALWAAHCAELALPIFESNHPADMRLHEAISGGRDFGRGKMRDKALRIVALAALKAGKGVDEPSKYAARAATLAASVAYTHTDLQTGLQGIRQARHVLGPAVYAALALETAAGGDPEVGDNVIRRAIESAPAEVRYLLKHMPPQPEENGRLGVLFLDLDSALRG
ncbi:MAG: putative immunity protein [Chloroflexota bacterium]